MNSDTVDVAFRINARTSLPATYPYPLYAALTRLWPWLHEAEDFGIFPLSGTYTNGTIRLKPQATLRLRASSNLLPHIIALTGKQLALGETAVQVGIPRVLPLRPAPRLYSRLVQIKLADMVDGVTPEAFLQSVRKQAAALSIDDAEIGLPLRQQGPHAGEPQRRVLYIKGERHVGFAVLVQGLTADESLRLQRHGLGGRRKMGCGLFLPVRG